MRLLRREVVQHAIETQRTISLERIRTNVMHVGARIILLMIVAFPSLVRANSHAPPQILEVPIPRIDAMITVDGFLNEPEWNRAALLTGFSQFNPVDGRPSVDSTHVLVWYAPTGIHVGVRAFETHADVRATLADRDKISGDDNILLILDTFDDQRQAIVIAANPLGIQADGIVATSSGGRRSFSTSGGSGSSLFRTDLNPDYVFESSGRLTAFGYEVEFFVPFKSLRYQPGREQNWGFNVVRNVQHSGYSHSWAPILRSNASFLAQSGKLTGFTNLKRGLVLDLNPEITNAIAGASLGDKWEYETPTFDVDDLGGNLRWGATNNLTVNATVNPDFSQVEADVAQNQFDPRRALFFPEKRPFFIDGVEYFSMPQNLIYTRRLMQPISAVKITGKISGTNIGILSGVDKKSSSITGQEFRYLNAIRVTRDILGQSRLGIAYTYNQDGNHLNQVASFDGRLILAEKYTVTFQGSGSFTRDAKGVGTRFAPLWTLSASRAGRKFGFRASFSGIHDQFNAESGFISRAGIVTANVNPRLTWYSEEGALVESVTANIALMGRWTYDRFTAGKEPDDQQLHPRLSVVLRGGWSVSARLFIESFKYPDELYEDYYIERTQNGVVVDTVSYVGTNRLSNFMYGLSLNTPRFDTFSGSVFLLYGSDDNFQEWAPANFLVVTTNANWNPTDQLRVNFRYNHQQYIRPSDRSNVTISRIPRLKIEYQINRALFLRLVTQYDSFIIDQLRDNSRTDDPILIKDSEGEFHRTEKFRRNNLTVDWLFSYRPVPGTVVFFGYGASLAETQTFRFRNLDRLSDGFFMKLSYLFRV
ncbi:MAG: DUF5916 domain-containing protein [Rhodothermia bacterium]|nr:MAG: DUF5916 domain-containing protein [Rhodothermia bacterium]